MCIQIDVISEMVSLDFLIICSDVMSFSLSQYFLFILCIDKNNRISNFLSEHMKSWETLLSSCRHSVVSYVVNDCHYG
jgi:hypothetical protein